MSDTPERPPRPITRELSVPKLNGELDEPTTDPAIQVDVGYFKRKMEEMLRQHDNKLTWRSVFVAIGAVAAAVIAGILFIDTRVAAQTDAGVKVHETRIVALEQQVPQIRKEQYEYRTDTRADMKALQEVVLTRVRSERLDQPVKPPEDLPMFDAGVRVRVGPSR